MFTPLKYVNEYDVHCANYIKISNILKLITTKFLNFESMYS